MSRANTPAGEARAAENPKHRQPPSLVNRSDPREVSGTLFSGQDRQRNGTKAGLGLGRHMEKAWGLGNPMIAAQVSGGRATEERDCRVGSRNRSCPLTRVDQLRSARRELWICLRTLCFKARRDPRLRPLSTKREQTSSFRGLAP